jgi:hypothetical protein
VGRRNERRGATAARTNVENVQRIGSGIAKDEHVIDDVAVMYFSKIPFLFIKLDLWTLTDRRDIRGTARNQ